MANDFTQEEKRAAENRVDELYMAHPHGGWVVYVELAERLQMQNTRLLEALKLLIEDPRFQVSIGGNPHAVEKAYAQIVSAIAMAGGK
jgi:hypothetical protein